MTRNPRPGDDGEHVTFCRLCEAFCGLVVTVEGGKVAAIRPDRDNPHSQGHICVKGVAMAEVAHDPQRVTRPLKRVGGPGEFEPVSWDEALDDIAAKLAAIRRDHGGGAIASYLGNPTAYSTNSFMGFNEFMAAVGSEKPYGAGSQDSNARLTANYILYGAPALLGINDFIDCDFLLVVGANPLVSNGWMMFVPRIRHDLDAIAQRGRVVVVDPRATETARRYEHVAVRADSDVWLLLGMLRTLIDERLIDTALVEEISVGWETLAERIADVSLAEAAAHTGLEAATIAQLALDFAASERGAIYGGLGLCRGNFGALGAFLLSALNAVAGKYGAPGGIMFGRPVLAGSNRSMVGGYGDSKTRIGGIPTIAGFMASAMLPADIEEPGEDRVRALVISAGNPVVSGPGGERLERALAKLDLMVSFDLYETETNRYAHYILPSTTFLERPDWPFIGLNVMMRPFLQYTDAVIPPVGEARDEYGVFCDIARRMGMGAPSPSPEKQALGEQGLLPDPVGQIDMAVRMGPAGECLGEDGWSMERLREHPHGVMVDAIPSGAEDWRFRLGYPDGKLRLWHELLEPEFERLFAGRAKPRPELTLIGRRDIRSMNSWMHNIERLTRSQEPALLIHPDDAADCGIEDGDLVRLWNDNGEIHVHAEVSDEIVRGTVSYPHGWGHAAGWKRANETRGRNMNVLLGLGVESVEFVSGMTLIDCVGVSVERSLRNAPARTRAMAV